MTESGPVTPSARDKAMVKTPSSTTALAASPLEILVPSSKPPDANATGSTAFVSEVPSGCDHYTLVALAGQDVQSLRCSREFFELYHGSIVDFAVSLCAMNDSLGVILDKREADWLYQGEVRVNYDRTDTTVEELLAEVGSQYFTMLNTFKAVSLCV